MHHSGGATFVTFLLCGSEALTPGLGIRAAMRSEGPFVFVQNPLLSVLGLLFAPAPTTLLGGRGGNSVFPSFVKRGNLNEVSRCLVRQHF